MNREGGWLVKVGERNQAGSQPGLTRDTLQLSGMESTRAGGEKFG